MDLIYFGSKVNESNKSLVLRTRHGLLVKIMLRYYRSRLKNMNRYDLKKFLKLKEKYARNEKIPRNLCDYF